MLLLLFILILLLLEGLLSQSLVSSLTEARSTTSWSALQNSPSSRRANSSPGISCLLQATQRKQSIWYEFSRAFITKSFLANVWSHFEHFCPNNLKKDKNNNIRYNGNSVLRREKSCLRGQRQGLEVTKFLSCSNEMSMQFILLITVKMPTIVGILTFISSINSQYNAWDFFILVEKRANSVLVELTLYNWCILLRLASEFVNPRKVMFTEAKLRRASFFMVDLSWC